MIIDAHCHIGQGLMNGWEIETLIKEMNEHHIDKTILVPWDQAIAVHNEQGNRYVQEQSDKYPNRFIPFCTVNPWWGGEAVLELERAHSQGAKGLKLHPVYQGFQLSDPIVKPVIKAAVERNMPIYIPTGIPVMSMPLQLKHLAQEFTDGVFIQGHFGATDFWIDAIPSVVDCPNIYVDTAYNMISSIENAIKLVGSSRVIFSSDAPYMSLAGEIEKISWLTVSEEEREQICSGNIVRILEGSQK